MRCICAPIVPVVMSLCTLLAAGVASADLLTVCPDGSCDFTEIQDAIDASNGNDTILVYPGTYTGEGSEVINTHGKEITVFATEGPEETIIDGEDERRGVWLDGSWAEETVIEGFTITRCKAAGSGQRGGGMYITGGCAIVNNCVFVDNRANHGGGGLYVSGDEFACRNITGCSFVENDGGFKGGGAYARDTAAQFSDCSFTRNEASYGGGLAIVDWTWDKSPISIESCLFEDNRSIEEGAGLYAEFDWSWITVTDSTFAGNTATKTNSGGGISIKGYGGNFAVGDSYFCLNSPDHISGGYEDWGGNTFGSSCACPDGPCIIYVPADYPTIQDAIDDAGNGDVIEVAPGTYYEALDFHGRGALTLRAGIGRGGVVVDAGGVGTAMDMSDELGSGNITVEGITITGGYAERGGGVYVDGNFAASFEDCTITGNESWGDGGGVYASQSWNSAMNNASFLDCVISNNLSAEDGGGIWYHRLLNNNGSNENGTPPILSGCTISNNTATDTGGGVYVYSASLFNNNGSITTAFDDCVISQNTAGRGGGAGFKFTYYPWNNNGSNNNGSNNNGSDNGNGTAVPIILRNCSIVDNTASEEGGGLWLPNSDDYSVWMHLDACQVRGNQSDYGGGLHAGNGSVLEVISSTFDLNAAYFGGGMYMTESDETIVSNSLFLENEGAYGGGIYNSIGSLDLDGTTFTGNEAYQGGAIFEFETISVISGSSFDENTAAEAGGAIYNLVSLSEIDTTHFCSNTPDDIHGAWFNEGDVTFEAICGSPAVCMGDTNADYNVDVLDLLYVILVWNTDNPLADFNEDGFVDVLDLLQVIANWGMCE